MMITTLVKLFLLTLIGSVVAASLTLQPLTTGVLRSAVIRPTVGSLTLIMVISPTIVSSMATAVGR